MKQLGLQWLRLFFGLLMFGSGAIAVSTTSHGYSINTTGPSGTPPNSLLRWFPVDLPAPWAVNLTPPAGLTSAEWVRTFKKAMRTWTDLPTSDYNFCIVGTTAAEINQTDADNTLCALTASFNGGGASAGILAITHYYYLPSGQITGNDMEFNSKDFTWSTAFSDERANVPNPGGDSDYDLQSIMAHELGHAIGFGHSITGPGMPSTPPDYDNNGTGTTADDQINGPFQNTMDPATLKGETFQRSLASDDIAAMDSNYPAAGTTLTRPSAFLFEPDGVNDTPAGGNYLIQWLGQYEGASNPTVSLYYTTTITTSAINSLSGATLIAAGLPSPKDGSVGSYNWVFNGLPAGNYYIIAVVTADSFTRKDLSPGVVTVTVPVLTLTAPTAAGITLTPYANFAVTWTASGQDLGPVRIDLSLDNGVTFPHTVTSATNNTGTYSFAVPDPVKKFGTGPQTTCKLRISYIADATVKSVSANPFTIALAADSLVVNSPNGGEFLTAGASAPIQFNASGPLVGDNFHIQYSPDMGLTWNDIETNIQIVGPNPRLYAWTVPGAFVSTNLIRVESVTTRKFIDASDSPFTIGPNTPSQFVSVPANLTFDVMVGGADPADQTITITNAKASTAITGVTVTKSTPKLTTPGAPTTIPANLPAVFTVHLNVTGLTAGTINGSVTFKSTGVADLIVPVTINVVALGTTLPLTYNPTSLAFSAAPGSFSPAAKTISVTNPAGNVNTTVDVVTLDAALLVSPGRFSLAASGVQNLTVLTDTAGLPSGTVKNSAVTTKATVVGSGNFTVTTTITGAAATPPRQKNKASPCALRGGDAAAPADGAALVGMLFAIGAVALLRRGLRPA